MRLMLAIWMLFGVVGCFCMVRNAQDCTPHSHREHTLLTFPTEAEIAPAAETSTAPQPAAPPRMSAVLFARGPEVLRNLARILIITIQFWRA